MARRATKGLMALCMALVLFISTLALGTASAARNVFVTLRGKRYEVSAATVADITREMEDRSGLKPGQQAVLFKGKMLASDETLDNLGVSDGDTLNIVPQSSKPAASKPATRPAPMSLSEEDDDVAPSAAGGLGGSGDDLMKMLNSIMGSGALGSLAGKDLSKLSPADAQKMFEGVDMSKVLKMYQAFIWQLVRSPVVGKYLESDENMNELRLKLKDSFEKVQQNPEVAAQIQPLLTDDFKAMLEDTGKFREELQKVVDFYQQMPDPNADGNAFDFDMSALTGMAKAADDDMDDLDNLPDDDKEL